MTEVSQRIKALEQEMNISMLTPWKVVLGFVVVAGLAVIGWAWWTRPHVITDDNGELCTKRLTQFGIAVAVGLASLAWLLWNWYQG